MSEVKALAPAAILKQYFGFHPNQTLNEFMQEVKALSPADKKELVDGAAKELGVTVKG